MMFDEVDAFLFDLDDTLLNTHAIFKKKLSDVGSILSKISNEDRRSVTDEIFAASQDAYEKFSINPTPHWKHVLQLLTKRFSLSKEESDIVLDMIYSIYKTTPDVFEGVEDLLGLVRANYSSVALVTHAERDWTVYKLESTGLDKYFENIYLVDVNEYKSKQHWLDASEKFGLDRSHSCVVGDSLGGDIIPAYESGYSTVVHIKSDLAWKSHGDLELPKNVIQVNNPMELLELLRK